MSGSQTTSFNVSITLVNTGGDGIATVGYFVNGQQIWNESYLVHASSQFSYLVTLKVHACYGVVPPTYTAVILSEQ